MGLKVLSQTYETKAKSKVEHVVKFQIWADAIEKIQFPKHYIISFSSLGADCLVITQSMFPLQAFGSTSNFSIIAFNQGFKRPLRAFLGARALHIMGF